MGDRAYEGRSVFPIQSGFGGPIGHLWMPGINSALYVYPQVEQSTVILLLWILQTENRGEAVMLQIVHGTAQAQYLVAYRAADALTLMGCCAHYSQSVT
jgi:hypothetical protein